MIGNVFAIHAWPTITRTMGTESIMARREINMESFEQERFTVYQLSKKAKVIIKEGSRTITINKRVNPIQEVSIRINGDELAALFHILNMRTLTEDAIKAMTKEKGGDDANQD
jgi:hypothetical protein